MFCIAINSILDDILYSYDKRVMSNFFTNFCFVSDEIITANNIQLEI